MKREGERVWEKGTPADRQFQRRRKRAVLLAPVSQLAVNREKPRWPDPRTEFRMAYHNVWRFEVACVLPVFSHAQKAILFIQPHLICFFILVFFSCFSLSASGSVFYSLTIPKSYWPNMFGMLLFGVLGGWIGYADESFSAYQCNINRLKLRHCRLFI